MTKIELRNDDPNASKRKSDHIDLAFNSRTGPEERDPRFHYEPFLSAHPAKQDKMPMSFLGKHLDFPIWVSSMTGGTEKANLINRNLAKIAGKFKLGMGLGSCRSLLNSDEYLEDFSVRKYLGDQPLFANLGIAQVEELVETDSLNQIDELLKKLEADGLIVHINPLQEFIQPEGDQIRVSPVETMTKVLDKLKVRIVLKEVGQGFGPASLKKMMQMPFDAIEFGAYGGTNFASLELSRSTEEPRDQFKSLAYVGHPAEEMIELINAILEDIGERVLCQDYIVSGGIRNFMDGYYGISKLKANAVYGMASGFLQHALGSYEELEAQVEKHLEGLKIANAFLQVK